MTFCVDIKLHNKIKKNAKEEIEAMKELHSKKQKSSDYYKGYEEGMANAVFTSCHEAFDMLEYVSTRLDNKDIKDRIEKFLKGL